MAYECDGIPPSNKESKLVLHTPRDEYGMYDSKWKKPDSKSFKNSNYIVFYKRQHDRGKKWVLVSVRMGEATDHKGSERAPAVSRLSYLLIMV